MSIDQSLPNGQMTAELLQGSFRFKPRGSVETADPSRQRADTTQLIQFLPMVLQLFPSLAPMFQTPQAGRAFLRQVFRTYRWENTQAILGSPSQDLGGGPAAPPDLMRLLQHLQMGGASAPGGPTAPGPQVPGLPGTLVRPVAPHTVLRAAGAPHLVPGPGAPQ